jgi:Na+/H+ antiporter NhaD/arsenite permease-like protein
MTLGVANIFISIIAFISLIEYLQVKPMLAVSLLIFMVSFSVATFIYFGMQDEKMKMEPKPKKNHPMIEKLCSIIMMLATVIFLLLGFLGGLWNIAWIAFPIGGILCGMVNVVFNKND